MPILGIVGSLGAVIRLRGRNQTKKQFFDVGIAGPLAGFVVALMFLIYGFVNIPPQEDIVKIHPEYQTAINEFGVENYQDHVYVDKEEGMMIGIGGNLLFTFLAEVFVEDSKEYINEAEPLNMPSTYIPFYDKINSDHVEDSRKIIQDQMDIYIKKWNIEEMQRRNKRLLEIGDQYGINKEG